MNGKPTLASSKGRQRAYSSAIDALPNEIREQLVEARINNTHYVPEMVAWLHSEEFEGEFDHVTVPMLNHWFLRRGMRVNS